MAKIMLVEDDNNLREIYEARLLAEGYEIVSAKDGEEALAMAVKERPDLIISDVMMPKISGFDMLDILRTNPETQNTRVIMMTALSQAEDKARADKLGADRYLVKSQVTLEDVAKVAREVLDGGGDDGAMPAGLTSDAPAPQPTIASTPQPVAVEPAPEPVAAAPASEPVAPSPQPVVNEPTSIPVASAPDDTPSVDATAVAAQNAAQMANVINEALEVPPTPEPSAPTQEGTGGQRVIQPINDISEQKPDFNQLVKEEEARENAEIPGGTIAPTDPNSTAL